MAEKMMEKSEYNDHIPQQLWVADGCETKLLSSGRGMIYKSGLFVIL
jgi:hypothetical protein